MWVPIWRLILITRFNPSPRWPSICQKVKGLIPAFSWAHNYLGLINIWLFACSRRHDNRVLSTDLVVRVAEFIIILNLILLLLETSWSFNFGLFNMHYSLLNDLFLFLFLLLLWLLLLFRLLSFSLISSSSNRAVSGIPHARFATLTLFSRLINNLSQINLLFGFRYLYQELIRKTFSEMPLIEPYYIRPILVILKQLLQVLKSTLLKIAILRLRIKKLVVRNLCKVHFNIWRHS